MQSHRLAQVCKKNEKRLELLHVRLLEGDNGSILSKVSWKEEDALQTREVKYPDLGEDEDSWDY